MLTGSITYALFYVERDSRSKGGIYQPFHTIPLCMLH